eukprot:Awhi_evm1s1239
MGFNRKEHPAFCSTITLTENCKLEKPNSSAIKDKCGIDKNDIKYDRKEKGTIENEDRKEKVLINNTGRNVVIKIEENSSFNNEQTLETKIKGEVDSLQAINICNDYRNKTSDTNDDNCNDGIKNNNGSGQCEIEKINETGNIMGKENDKVKKESENYSLVDNSNNTNYNSNNNNNNNDKLDDVNNDDNDKDEDKINNKIHENGNNSHSHNNNDDDNDDNQLVMSWFAQRSQHRQSPVIQRLLSPSEKVFLFCRLVGEPYVCFGELTFLNLDDTVRPMQFQWRIENQKELHKTCSDFE